MVIRRSFEILLNLKSSKILIKTENSIKIPKPENSPWFLYKKFKQINLIIKMNFLIKILVIVFLIQNSLYLISKKGMDKWEEGDLEDKEYTQQLKGEIWNCVSL